MKIVKNNTHFNSQELKSLFCVIHNHIAKHHKLGKLKGWHILNVFLANKVKGRLHSGCAYVGYSDMLYGLKSKGWNMYLSINRKESIDGIIQLFGHELYHSYGFNHKDYPDAKVLFVDWEVDKIKAKFGKELTVKPEPKKRLKPVNTIWKQIDDFHASTTRYEIVESPVGDWYIYDIEEDNIIDYCTYPKEALRYAKRLESESKS